MKVSWMLISISSLDLSCLPLTRVIVFGPSATYRTRHNQSSVDMASESPRTEMQSDRRPCLETQPSLETRRVC